MESLSVYTIPAQLPFADQLAHGLLARAGGDPMVLAGMRLLLPSRRAIRSVREAFLRLSEGKPLLLPQMQPIGDVDEEELMLTAAFPGVANESALLPAISPSRRILLLARLIWRFHRLEYGPESRLDQAVQLARELASFLDDAAREELNFDALEGLVPAELAAHWQITLNFLQIIIRQWPGILAEEGRVDPIGRRNQMLHALAAHWQAHPPAYPVIVAGTTGSTPATAALLRVVAGLPDGLVILPAFDRDMDNAGWEALEPSHPQFGMKQLLQGMGLPRAEVGLFPPESAAADTPRVALLQEALRPAATSDGWRQVSLDWQSAVSGMLRIDCATLQEEATTIALLLRDTLESSGKTAALVTPNRDLARRVAAILRRCHVIIDDSGGIPLSDTPPGIFLHLVGAAVAARAAPVALLAMLKHPLALAGGNVGECRQLARLLEVAVLRGVRLAPGFEPIMEAVRQNAKLADYEKDKLLSFIGTAATILRPCMALTESPEVPLRQLLAAHMAAAEALASGKGSVNPLWQGETGEAVSLFLHEMAASAEGIESIDPHSYLGVFSTLMAGRVWRPHYGLHPRLHILSPMEARLQQFDRVVLGGLNEGGWPMDVGQDPWMSRPMREAFGLPSPERQIGLSAHDFYSLAVASEVVMTRAQKEGGSPTVPSRWLLRLEAVLGVLGGEEAVAQWHEAGGKWRHWARQWDWPETVTPIAPPAPRPPVEARPRSLYVTRVETLLRNPYGLYASHILGLKKLDPLDQEPGAADFGSLVHAAIEAYIRNPENPPDADAKRELLLACGRQAFSHLLERPAVAAFWWPRFERIAGWLAAVEAERQPALEAVLAEEIGEVTWRAPAGDFTLKARMDRLECYRDGTLCVVDYKTGSIPTAAEMARGIACQLLLEAMIAAEGKVEGLSPPSGVADCEYWQLRGGREPGLVMSLASAAKEEDFHDWVARAAEGVRLLIAAYDDPSTPYLHCPVPADAPRYNDYEHLSRVREWGAE